MTQRETNDHKENGNSSGNRFYHPLVYYRYDSLSDREVHLERMPKTMHLMITEGEVNLETGNEDFILRIEGVVWRIKKSTLRDLVGVVNVASRLITVPSRNAATSDTPVYDAMASE